MHTPQPGKQAGTFLVYERVFRFSFLGVYFDEEECIVITFVAHIDGSRVLGIGLTDGDMKRLRGVPISLTAEEAGLPYPMNMLIFWGRSDEEMEKEVHADGKYGPDIRAHVQTSEDQGEEGAVDVDEESEGG